MFHIDDIRARLQANPEPPEVAAIREKILNTFNKLEFVEEGHKYYLPDGNGNKEELISVSKMIEEYVPYVDWDEVCARKAAKLGMDPKVLRRQWKENNLRATTSGSVHHLFGEMYQHFYMGYPEEINEVMRPQYVEGFFIPVCAKQEAICKFYEDIAACGKIWPVLAETKVYMGVNDTFNIKHKFAGTFDMLFAYQNNQGEWLLLVYDYKTNSSLYGDYVRNNRKMMMDPFDDVFDESYGHYVVQLSAYELALRQLGFKVADRKLIWLKDDGTYEKISTPCVVDRLVNCLS